METGCAIGGTTSRRQYAGGRRRGLSRQPDVQLAPCAWRLSKQFGPVRAAEMGANWRWNFIARGTGSARRSIGAGAARRGARVLSGSTRENAARALIDYSPRTATASLRTDRRIGRPRGWAAFGWGFDPARQPGLNLRRRPFSPPGSRGPSRRNCCPRHACRRFRRASNRRFPCRASDRNAIVRLPPYADDAHDIVVAKRPPCARTCRRQQGVAIAAGHHRAGQQLVPHIAECGVSLAAGKAGSHCLVGCALRLGAHLGDADRHSSASGR